MLVELNLWRDLFCQFDVNHDNAMINKWSKQKGKKKRVGQFKDYVS